LPWAGAGGGFEPVPDYGSDVVSIVERVRRDDPWQEPFEVVVMRLGAEPTDRDRRSRWLAAVNTVSAYRDRYAVTSAQPLGGPTRSDTQRTERRRAGQAVRRAQRIAAEGGACHPQTLAADPLAIG
jgi:hypothetical protein